MRVFIKDALLLSVLPLLAGLVFAIASLAWGERYVARATLLYGTGPDYRAQTWTESDGDSSRWTLERVLNTEAEILNSDELKRKVVRNIDLEQLLGGKAKRTPESGHLIRWLREFRMLPQKLPSEVAGLQVLRGGLEIKPVKNSGIIHVTFAHSDKALSVDVLRRVLDAYMILRRSVLQTDHVAPLKNELERQQAAYEALLQQRASLAKQYRIGEVNQDRRRLDERQSTLMDEARQLARQLASTNKQLELHESLGTLGPEKLTELNAERAGLSAAETSVETQLRQTRDEMQRMDQASSAFGSLNQEIEARKAAIGKLQEMLAAAEISSSLSQAIPSPRILEAPRSEDLPASLPPVIIGGLAALACLIALIAARVLKRREESVVVARRGGVHYQRSVSPLAVGDGDQPGPYDVKQKGIRNIIT